MLYHRVEAGALSRQGGAAELALIDPIPGGTAQLAKVDALIAGGSAKVSAEIAVCRTVLVLLGRGANVRYIGLDIKKSGTLKKLTEIDILTNEEMIEIKTGDYSGKDRLSGRDKDQFVNLRNFFESKITVVDMAGVGIGPPARFVYQFTQPIHADLYRWLKDNRVTEVRTTI